MARYTYLMEIYPPKDRETVDSIYISASPFIPLAKLDLVYLKVADTIVKIEQTQRVVTVNGDGDITDKISVFTTDIP